MPEFGADIVQRVQQVLQAEGNAVLALRGLVEQQGPRIGEICKLIVERCGEGGGRLVIGGVGKAGLIGRKISATFASTGTPSFFLHPGEARHGDLGMLREDDVVLLLSNSGSSEEVLALLPSLRRIGCAVVALIGRDDAPLVDLVDLVLCYGEVVEACPLGLAPSTSTTVMLALGDALALSVLELRRFTPEEYARFHPGGALGRKLMHCAEAMRSGERIARVAPETALREAIRAITAARAGCALLVDGEGRLLGIFTDGDLRRVLGGSEDPAAVLAAPVREHATVPCRSVPGGALVQQAIHICAQYHIDELPVVDDDERVVGLLDLQDLADRGFELGG